MSESPGAGAASFFHQPRAVWAVAFAAVVSFMGLGLVDPILPAIAKDLRASPSDVELLFTSSSRSPGSRCSRRASWPAASGPSARCSAA